jgi:hypothetical protein
MSVVVMVIATAIHVVSRRPWQHRRPAAAVYRRLWRMAAAGGLKLNCTVIGVSLAAVINSGLAKILCIKRLKIAILS